MNGYHTNDVLDQLLSGMEQDNSLNQTELLANVYIFFLAGHETTAAALGSAVAELADKPDIQEKLYQEITNRFGTEHPCFESMHHDPPLYLQNFIMENLRLHPPAEIIPTRRAIADIQYQNQIIPRNSVVSFNIRVIHRHPDHWEEPDKFDPDRFLPEKKRGRHKFAYLPFSLGPRHCLGNEFSEIEQRLLLVRLLQRFKVLPPKNNPKRNLNDYHPFGSIPSSWIRLEKRN